MSESTQTAAAPQRSTLTGELLAVAVVAAGIAVFGIAAPSAYSAYLMIHIVAAVVWVGGGTIIAALAFAVERERDPVLLGRFAALAGKVGTRVFLPSSLVLLIFGFVLVSKGSWGYGHFWVIFALLGWAASFVTGIAVLRPLSAKVGEVVPQRGIDDPEAQALIKRIIVIDRWQVLLLLLVVADMAAKPFS